MFGTRLVTAAVLLALFSAALILLPNVYWGLLLLAGLAVAAAEWGALARMSPALRGLAIAIMLVSGSALLYLLHETANDNPGLITIPLAVYWLAAIFWVVVAPAWLLARWAIRSSLLIMIAGWIVLVPAWLAMVALQREPAQLLIILGVVWIADTAAYIYGRRFGRRRLAPQISPGKTWEGLLGAAGAVAVYYGIVWFIFGPPWQTSSLLPGIILFAVVFAMSVQGDLFESLMKRQAGVKDSGTLFPGHGGVLDRIDGLTASMPFAALWLHYFGFPVSS